MERLVEEMQTIEKVDGGDTNREADRAHLAPIFKNSLPPNAVRYVCCQASSRAPPSAPRRHPLCHRRLRLLLPDATATKPRSIFSELGLPTATHPTRLHRRGAALSQFISMNERSDRQSDHGTADGLLLLTVVRHAPPEAWSHRQRLVLTLQPRNYMALLFD
ncbi:hypothetical protein GUJ93_ZPchr0002g26298 [Zizania palustris]|uniref:Uncharacterized protein n=1 Tax=Zizania palustris TaxID=103762 RepID=A0A8J5VTW6_ZIZPA|nr:hypothetical protein GUJ93_ZPchr0002g26298 [Zizania palustris]